MSFLTRISTLLLMEVLSFFCELYSSANADNVNLSSWVQTEGFSGARTSLGAAIYGNRIYVLGGLSSTQTDFSIFNDVQTAIVGNDGLIIRGSWRTTRSLPVGRSGPGVVIVNNRIYVVAGYAKSGTLNDAVYASILEDGSLGDWTTDPHHLNTPRSNHRLEVFSTPSGSRYLAAIAGVGEVGSDTVHFGDIEVARLNQDGSLGDWKSCPYRLKGGRSAPATLVIKGRLYVIGGWGDLLDDVFRDVQYASIRDDGCVDPWRTSPYSINTPLYGLTSGVTASGQTIALIFGGNAGNGNYFSNTQSAPVSINGEIGPWSFENKQFAIPRWGHASVQSGEFIYILGGARIGNPSYLSDTQVTVQSRN